MKTYQISVEMRPITELRLNRDAKDPLLCIRKVLAEQTVNISSINVISIKVNSKKLEFLGNREKGVVL